MFYFSIKSQKITTIDYRYYCIRYVGLALTGLFFFFYILNVGINLESLSAIIISGYTRK